MPRPGPRNLNRPSIFALAMLVGFALPIAARPARAAGCHLPDRPVLGLDQAERSDHHTPAWALLGRGDLAPPILTRVPCPGETPRTTVIATGLSGAAGLVGAVTTFDGPPCPFVAFENIELLDPHPSRLDRPPR